LHVGRHPQPSYGALAITRVLRTVNLYPSLRLSLGALDVCLSSRRPAEARGERIIMKKPTIQCFVAACALLMLPAGAVAQTDPGPRGGAVNAGARLPGLTTKEAKFFAAGLDEFMEVASVTGGVEDTEIGLGPRFNMNSCAACHSQPAIGGSSPASNPQVSGGPPAQVSVLTGLGILSADGPVREVRFTTDGGVHDLFTIMGLPDTPAACHIAQPDFAGAMASGTIRFRIPTPLFGSGLIEAIPDAKIIANAAAIKPFGITGAVNRNGNDGTVTRFGWKAQNKSLVIFAGEAYNVELGITNELFPDERGDSGVPDPAVCHQVVPAPQDSINYEITQPQGVVDNTGSFANFMRFLAPPAPVSSYGTVTAAQITAGETAFNKAGCNVCHLKSMTTGNHLTAALRFKTVNLFSDLLVHDVGTGDDIPQGLATGAQFRTAPLWGVGQRLFFLHDGSKTNLIDAITAHDGEAQRVINNYKGVSVGEDAPFNLTATERQNLIYFLRSL
jgi:CxxC motif-containing protein (DUF1111 family)